MRIRSEVVEPDVFDTGWTNQDGAIVTVADRFKLQPGYEHAPSSVERILHDTWGDLVHSAYLFGSVPRGVARPGRSDLDVLAVLFEPSSDAALAEACRARLISELPAVPSVDLVIHTLDEVAREGAGVGWGVFLHAFCVCVAGSDLRAGLPAYRPTVDVVYALTRSTFPSKLHEARVLLAGDPADQALIWACKKLRWLIRAAFALVAMRCWTWSPDLEQQAELVGRAFPEWEADVRICVDLGRDPRAERSTLARLLDGFGADLEARFAEATSRDPSVDGEPARGTTIRRFESSDAEAVRWLHGVGMRQMGVDRGPGPWDADLDDITAAYIRAGGEFLVCVRDDELIGMCGLLPAGSDVAMLKRLRVRPDRQRQGIGGMLARDLVSHARSLGFSRLVVDTTTRQEEAIALFRKLGFEELGRRPLDAFVVVDFEMRLG